MPAVLRRSGFKVVINSDDHRPAHVHVIGGSGIVIIKLNGRHQKPSVRENLGMNQGDLIKALRIAAENKKVLVKEWRRIHG